MLTVYYVPSTWCMHFSGLLRVKCLMYGLQFKKKNWVFFFIIYVNNRYASNCELLITFFFQVCVKRVGNIGKGLIWGKADCTKMPGSKLSPFQEFSEWIRMSAFHGGRWESSPLFCGNTGDTTFKTRVNLNHFYLYSIWSYLSLEKIRWKWFKCFNFLKCTLSS